MMAFIGLGNPGKRYEYTRHNLGQWCIQSYCQSRQLQLKDRPALMGVEACDGKNNYFFSTLFMNCSGYAAIRVKQYYQLKPEQMVIIYDDVDLPTGYIRLRKGGGAGGHNGMQHIITHCGGENIWRIRIGIDRSYPLATYVLSPLTSIEKSLFSSVFQKVYQVMDDLTIGEFEKAYQNAAL